MGHQLVQNDPSPRNAISAFVLDDGQSDDADEIDDSKTTTADVDARSLTDNRRTTSVENLSKELNDSDAFVKATEIDLSIQMQHPNDDGLNVESQLDTPQPHNPMSAFLSSTLHSEDSDDLLAERDEVVECSITNIVKDSNKTDAVNNEKNIDLITDAGTHSTLPNIIADTVEANRTDRSTVDLVSEDLSDGPMEGVNRIRNNSKMYEEDQTINAKIKSNSSESVIKNENDATFDIELQKTPVAVDEVDAVEYPGDLNPFDAEEALTECNEIKEQTTVEQTDQLKSEVDTTDVLVSDIQLDVGKAKLAQYENIHLKQATLPMRLTGFSDENRQVVTSKSHTMHKKVVKANLNPFGSDEDEQDSEEDNLFNDESSKKVIPAPQFSVLPSECKSPVAQPSASDHNQSSSSLNPFWSDGEEPPEADLSSSLNKSSHKPGKVKPPRPPPPTISREG